ncbi:hypothetical protein JZ751_021495 [Albula glossodonta]|uniref:Ion transport domain-containing protein n=1 Tax=Albula glossodonta TaxID=121402 RepID=A0A8T2NRX9_9TELE|nr:hypothetical protein JZ751_021495 [Albula glossodonta]
MEAERGRDSRPISLRVWAEVEEAIRLNRCMRILVNLLLDTLPMLGNVLLLCFFVFFIFGIIGVQLWAGLLHDERPFICSLAADNGIMSCRDVPARREGGRECCLDKDDVLQRQELGLSPEPLVNGSASTAGLCINWNQYYTRCFTGHSNPHKGAINFDNIGYAWIVIFQVITLEGWVEIMYYVMDAHSFYNFIYFIFLIIIGSFFMINLCLVVIATQFSETKQREHQLMQEQRAQCLSSSTLASMAEPGDCYEEIFQYVCHVLRKARRRSAALYNMLRGRPPPARTGRGGAGGGGGANASANGGDRHCRHPRCEWTSWVGEGVMVAQCPHHHGQEHSSHPDGNPVTLSITPNPEDCPHCIAAREHSANGDEEGGAVEELDGESNHLEERSGEEAEGEAGKKKKRTCFGRCKDAWDGMRVKLWGIVESKYFNRGIMIAILINTISMGIEHHDQVTPPWIDTNITHTRVSVTDTSGTLPG